MFWIVLERKNYTIALHICEKFIRVKFISYNRLNILCTIKHHTRRENSHTVITVWRHTSADIFSISRVQYGFFLE